jgi:ribosomal protein L10
LRGRKTSRGEMRRDQKEQVVEELTARLKAAETLLVAD